jgi:hypothetical protein
VALASEPSEQRETSDPKVGYPQPAGEHAQPDRAEPAGVTGQAQLSSARGGDAEFSGS